MPRIKAARKRRLEEYQVALTTWIKENVNILRKQFQPCLKADDLAPATEEKNWEEYKTYVAMHQTQIIHEFICKPYKKLIHGYVYTDLHSTVIQNVIAQVE